MVSPIRSSLTAGHVLSGCGLLAVAAHSTMYPVGLLVPLASAKPIKGILAFILASSVISIVSFAVVGNRWPSQTWGTA